MTNALTPYAKLNCGKAECFHICSAATEHIYHNMGHSHVQLEAEMSSDKEQLSKVR